MEEKVKAKKDKDLLATLKSQLEKLIEQREMVKENFQQISGAVVVLENIIKDAEKNT
tara:strand:+ start:1003 stop:1173 length:171 start_codon:yes stop_codon:yes gene_type:complete